jgi:hypothetical protein
MCRVPAIFGINLCILTSRDMDMRRVTSQGVVWKEDREIHEEGGGEGGQGDT